MDNFILIDERRRNNCIKHILDMDISGDAKYSVKIGLAKNIRSLAQNSAYWGVWLKTIAESTDHSAAVWHEVFKKLFIDAQVEEVNGIVVELRKSTTKLSKKKFSEYVEHVHKYAAEELNIVLPPLEIAAERYM